MTITDAPEIPLSLRMISELPECKITYNSLRQYVVRYREKGFPEPAIRNIAGKGMSWYPSEVLHFLKHMPDNRGAKNHKNSSERAKLGHRNRMLRANATCVTCQKKLPPGEEYIEYQPDHGTEVKIYDLVCAKIVGVWDGS